MADIDVIREIEEIYGIKWEKANRHLAINSYNMERGIVTSISFRGSASYDFENLMMSIKRLSKLEELRLSRFSDIKVESLKVFKRLKVLDMVNNSITDISGLSPLKELRELTLHSNSITDISVVANFRKLEKLHLFNNHITDISPLSDLSSLKSLSIESNGIQDVSPLYFLSQLEVLAASHNLITNITPLINFFRLKELELENNLIEDISSLSNLYELRKLLLQENFIKDIYPLSKLKNLETLFLDANEIHDISPLKNLKNLGVLGLSGNLLKDITPLKSILKNLDYLGLHDNLLTWLPEWILDSPFIRSDEDDDEYPEYCTDVSNNPLGDPPIEVIKQGKDAIKRYFERKKKEGGKTMREAKLILVGDGSAGKTSLQKRLLDSKAELPKEDTRTRGIAIEDWEYKKDHIAHIWDFGGQDVYYPVHRFFLTENSVFVLLASTRQERHNFDYWIPTIFQFGSSSPIIIGQTCHDGNRAAWSDLGGFVANPTFNIVKTQELPYYELNLMNRNSGLAAIKKVIISQLTDLPHCRKDVPTSWVQVRNVLKDLAENTACITYEKFKEICDGVPAATFSQPVDYSDCCEFFHNIGVLLWYSRNDTLSGWVILQPEWAMGAVYKIIDDGKIQGRKGHILASDFKRVWKDKAYEDKHNILKQMLNVFRVAFPKKHKKEDYILPARLVSIPCDKLWCEGSILHLEYHFGFMPKGLLNQVSAELSRYIMLNEENEEEVWNDAVNFVYDDAACQVKEDFFNRMIYLKARGKNARGLVVLIKEALDSAIANYKGVEYKILVPCSCKVCQKGMNVTKFNYSDLQRWEQNGRKQAICNESGDQMNIDDLLYNAGLFSSYTSKNKDMTKLKKITIFLASSSELTPDRKEFEIFINRENKKLIEQGIFLHLELWEDFLDKISKTRLQDEYNRAVKECDIFVSLFYTKAGKFTAEEFDTAYENFTRNDRPAIYTYFKDGDIKISTINPDDVMSLIAFRQRLKNIGHFPTSYENIDTLKHHFSEQLRMLLPKLTK